MQQWDHFEHILYFTKLFSNNKYLNRLLLSILCTVIFHSFGFNFSEIMVTGSDHEIRLIDDAFGKICNGVTDLSMNVRQLAAKLLGSMTLVSPKFLCQTLDKKLMSNMRKKVRIFAFKISQRIFSLPRKILIGKRIFSEKNVSSMDILRVFPSRMVESISEFLSIYVSKDLSRF